MATPAVLPWQAGWARLEALRACLGFALDAPRLCARCVAALPRCVAALPSSVAPLSRCVAPLPSLAHPRLACAPQPPMPPMLASPPLSSPRSHSPPGAQPGLSQIASVHTHTHAHTNALTHTHTHTHTCVKTHTQTHTWLSQVAPVNTYNTPVNTYNTHNQGSLKLLQSLLVRPRVGQRGAQGNMGIGIRVVLSPHQACVQPLMR